MLTRARKNEDVEFRGSFSLLKWPRRAIKNVLLRY